MELKKPQIRDEDYRWCSSHLDCDFDEYCDTRGLCYDCYYNCSYCDS